GRRCGDLQSRPDRQQHPDHRRRAGEQAGEDAVTYVSVANKRKVLRALAGVLTQAADDRRLADWTTRFMSQSTRSTSLTMLTDVEIKRGKTILTITTGGTKPLTTRYEVAGDQITMTHTSGTWDPR